MAEHNYMACLAHPTAIPHPLQAARLAQSGAMTPKLTVQLLFAAGRMGPPLPPAEEVEVLASLALAGSHSLMAQDVGNLMWSLKRWVGPASS